YYADAYYNMGILYLQTDSLDQAREHFELSVKMEPGYARAYYYLGLIAELLGHVEEARSHYGQSFKLDPTQKDVEDAQKRLKDVIE
ncbi:MAG: tetratricopeptide repeat protein, partial [Saprospiraceae bacterium]|nr:tetratricopeptide repeat protein [Saprospiraceae bacterium]